MMGVAESTVGRGVAARVGWAFWDNDLAVHEPSSNDAAVYRQEDGQASPYPDAADVTGDVLTDRQRSCDPLPVALSDLTGS
jgi:hypothetical protein